MKINADKKFLKAISYSLDCLDALRYLSAHRIPEDLWPDEIKAIGGINYDLLGPIEKNE